MISQRKWPRPALWLDANDASTLTLDSTNVSAWACKSTGTVFTNTGTNRPTYVDVAFASGTKKAIRFTKASVQYLGYTSALLSGSVGTMLAVVKTLTNTDRGILYSQSMYNSYLPTARWLRMGQTSIYEQQIFTNDDQGGGDILYSGTNALSDQSIYLIGLIIGSTYQQLRRSGNIESRKGGESGNVVWFGNIIAFGADRSCIGAAFSSTTGSPSISSPFDGYIAELIAWNSELDTIDLNSVEKYLAQKYGIAI